MTQTSLPESADSARVPTAMLVRQTGAMFLDAYRELQSRWLFWITLGLSGVVVGAFGAVGFNEAGITILWKQIALENINTRVIPVEELYKNLFTDLGVTWWLSWLAIILALVSTASLFPEFLSNGAVDLYLARPVSRVRLLLTKYAAGLLFTGLQVGVFCLASFLVIGLRGGVWLPGVFVAVPLVTLQFSYLWSICTLLGLLTRSTIASLLLTLTAWFLIFGIHSAEQTLLTFTVGNRVEQRELQRQIEQSTQVVRSLSTRPAATRPGSFETAQLRAAELARAGAEQRLAESNDWQLDRWHRLAYLLKLPLPKTAETAALMDRALDEQIRAPAERRRRQERDEEADVRSGGFWRSPRLRREVNLEVARLKRDRSLGYVLGTSLAFEAAVLGLTAWLFSRKDF